MPALGEDEFDPDPFRQFQAWFVDAETRRVIQPDAMALATATREGRPTLRMVLLKRVDERGFVFYTNYQSRKGRQLTENPSAALAFHWKEIQRQVSVVGMVSRLTGEESDEYFAGRPLGSQLAAWASRQSEVVADRPALEQAMADVTARYQGTVPRPPHWGGFRLFPETVEFWQHGDDRLHDRLRYRRAEGKWRIERLAP